MAQVMVFGLLVASESYFKGIPRNVGSIGNTCKFSLTINRKLFSILHDCEVRARALKV